ncbi:hypothetical protein HS088_TW21G00925 [Tripterygium wilfordii]|uniref:Uncharacterized protein n=1 Tax=Tripterygium wilfordii TaxID=458696 RepID=A0A7J7C3S6_TRIWF|nr:hypothetical protein HS088_TW21G00925 [Tripterygium wilfordii]
MATKRLLENPPSASSSSSGEEDEELPREDNPVGSDSETESDNNLSAFKIMPIIPKSAMLVVPEPEKSGDAKVIATAADETPKRNNKKMKAEKEKRPGLSNKPDQKSSDLSKKKKNTFPNTDGADVEMAEPSDEPTFHITSALPSKRARVKKPKANKSGKEKGKVVGDENEYPVGDKIVAVNEKSKGKKKVAAKGAENKNLLGIKIESLSEGLKGENKVEVVGDENEKDYLSLIGDGKGVWWEDLSKIKSDKAEELKKNWKKLKVEELELFILKKELLKETAIAVIDAMKASQS